MTRDRYGNVPHLGGRPSALCESVTVCTFLEIATFHRITQQCWTSS